MFFEEGPAQSGQLVPLHFQKETISQDGLVQLHDDHRQKIKFITNIVQSSSGSWS